MEWDCYDKAGNWVGTAKGANQDEALEYAVRQLGIGNVDKVVEREGSHGKAE